MKSLNMFLHLKCHNNTSTGTDLGNWFDNVSLATHTLLMMRHLQHDIFIVMSKISRFEGVLLMDHTATDIVKWHYEIKIPSEVQLRTFETYRWTKN